MDYSKKIIETQVNYPPDLDTPSWLIARGEELTEAEKMMENGEHPGNAAIEAQERVKELLLENAKLREILEQKDTAILEALAAMKQLQCVIALKNATIVRLQERIRCAQASFAGFSNALGMPTEIQELPGGFKGV